MLKDIKTLIKDIRVKFKDNLALLKHMARIKVYLALFKDIKA